MNRDENDAASSSGHPSQVKAAKPSGDVSPPAASASNADSKWLSLFRAGGRLVRWLLTHGLPMYAIVGTLLALSISAFLPRILPIIETALSNQPVQASAQAKPVSAASSTSIPSSDAAPGMAQEQSPSPVQSSVADATRPITEIAKMALDTSKDRIEGIKENYDKLFAMIAAFAALLGFLGFKGFESFAQAKARAEETVAKADIAVKRAEDAQRRVTESIAEHQIFRTEEYPKFASAELYLAHGIILREIADVYEVIAKHLSQAGQNIEFGEKVARLQESLAYLERSLDHCDRNNYRVRARALGTLGNVRKRLDDPMGALTAAKGAANAAPDDPSAHYNVACYAAMVAEDKARKCSPDSEEAMVTPFVDMCVEALTTAVKLHGKFSGKAMKDPDFDWVRKHASHGVAFKAALVTTVNDEGQAL
ncbi:hypothetical protein ABFG95_11825 [Achromobacter sp. HNDS-1]|uniref:Uncharacterized protein n=1 Tax=Achromobacter sp. HNDS-1 TaxID=3151598 RepID=A0AAU7LGV3_9BURK